MITATRGAIKEGENERGEMDDGERGGRKGREKEDGERGVIHGKEKREGKERRYW